MRTITLGMKECWASVAIDWFPVENGGRKQKPTGEYYAPTTTINGEGWSVLIDLENQRLCFLAEEAPHHLLVPNYEVALFEGNRKVGIATVLTKEEQLVGWKRFEPLFSWRDQLTDRWGNDLIYLLAGLGDPRNDIDPRLPSELKTLWNEFGMIDNSERWDYAEAYVRATGWNGKDMYDY